MKIEIRSRIVQDIEKLRNRHIIQEVQDFIIEAQQHSFTKLQQLYDIKQLSKQHFYRVRLDDYRLGCRYDIHSDLLIIMRLLHRADIYRFFP